MYYGGDDFNGTNLATTMSYTGGNWTPVTTTGTNPGPLDGPSLAYDAADGYVVILAFVPGLGLLLGMSGASSAIPPGGLELASADADGP